MTENNCGEWAVNGLHDYLLESVVPHAPGSRALDLGCGSGDLARSLHARNFEVTACDRVTPTIDGVTTRNVDFDSEGWPRALDPHFDLIVAVEVIEHLENPQRFLRQVASLLTTDGLAIVTSPRFESIAARLQFLRKGTLRLMDAHGDPTHTSPIFKDLVIRQYLPRSGLQLVEARHYPEVGSAAMRPLNQAVLRIAARLPRLRTLVSGDVNVFLLRRAPGRNQSE